MVSRKMVIFQIIFRAALDAIFAGLRLHVALRHANSQVGA